MTRLTAHMPLRYVARAVIEFTTPFIIGAGQGDIVSDAACVADANGLPAIPGTSLAGVLRHALTSCRDAKLTDNLFGSQDAEGCGSRLSVSWGCLHDSTNCPVEGLIDEARFSDPVLISARTGMVRDHVRINHYGAAESRGKFDERVIAAGHRFTFEIILKGSSEDHDDWELLVNLIRSGNLRLGGKTRRGFGAFKLISLCQQSFDLAGNSGFDGWLSHPVSLAERCQLAEVSLENPVALSENQHVTASLQLQPEGFWMIGGGKGDTADMTPVTDVRIIWKDGLGRPGETQALLPGSSLKGALAHRVAYHANLLCGRYVEDGTALTADECTEVKNFFGFCKGENDAATGQAGRVFIDDVHIDMNLLTQKHVNHVAIDRFTGGAIDGALFDEAPFFAGPQIEAKITIDVSEYNNALATESKKALKMALDDLVEGRLGIGSGVNRGNGFFSGNILWSDGGLWINGGAQ